MVNPVVQSMATMAKRRKVFVRINPDLRKEIQRTTIAALIRKKFIALAESRLKPKT